MNEFALKVRKNERKIMLSTCSILLVVLIALLITGVYAYENDNVQLFKYVLIADIIIHVPVLAVFGVLFWSTGQKV